MTGSSRIQTPHDVGHVVQVVGVDLDDPIGAEAVRRGGHALLADSEKARANMFVNTNDSARYQASWIALRYLLKAAGADLSATQEIGRAVHGKPYVLGGPEFSLSRSGRYALVAISSGDALGVDIEQIRSMDVPCDWDMRYPALKQALFGTINSETTIATTDSPHAFLRAWTRLEAVAKRYGTPLSNFLDGQTFPPQEHIHDLDVTPQCLAALACGESKSFHVKWFDWSGSLEQMASP